MGWLVLVLVHHEADLIISHEGTYEGVGERYDDFERCSVITHFVAITTSRATPLPPITQCEEKAPWFSTPTA